MKKNRIWLWLMVIIAFLAISQTAWGYTYHPECDSSSSRSSVESCCPTEWDCVGTDRYHSCFVSDDFLEDFGVYSCQCFVRYDDSYCLNPPNPVDDLYLYDHDFDPNLLYTNQEFSLDVEIKNRNSDSSICYEITAVDVDFKDITLSVTEDDDYSNATLCGGEKATWGPFIATPTQNGSLEVEINVKIDGSYIEIDSFNTTVSPIQICNNTCNSGDVGCTDIDTRWTCVQDGNGCWYQSNTDCSFGYECSNGSCILVEQNTPPELVSPTLIGNNQLAIAYIDTDGDPALSVDFWLFDENENYLEYIPMTVYVGTWYSVDLDHLANGNYKYWVTTSDGQDSGYYPVNLQGYGQITICHNECGLIDTGCVDDDTRWSCTQDAYGCYVKVNQDCINDQQCSNGTCQSIQPPATPTLNASVANVRSGVSYSLTWTDVNAGYEIEEGINNVFSPPTGESLAGTSKVYSHTVSSKTTYYYRVRAFANGLYSNWSNIVMVVVDPCIDECTSGAVGCAGTDKSWSCGNANDGDICLDKVYTTCALGYQCLNGSCIENQAPATPTLYRSTSIVRNSIGYTISWTNVNAGYQIQESINNFTSSLGWSQAGTSKVFSHTVSSKTTYYYRVRAVDNGLYSNWSNTVIVVVDPCSDECSSAETGCSSVSQRWSCGEANDGDICLDKIYTTCPTDYQCVNGSCDEIIGPDVPVLSVTSTTVSNNETYTFTWTDVASAYEFQFSTTSDFSNPIGWSQTANSKSISSVVGTITIYYFRVRSFDGNLYSNWSNIVSVTIDPCVDECALYTTGCNGTAQSWICGESFDGDICLDKVYTDCTQYEACNNGICELTCIDDCLPDSLGCYDINTVSKCQLSDDGCYHMQEFQSCNVDLICNSGECVPKCIDTCNSGESGCANADYEIWTCQLNDDGCWQKVYEYCPEGIGCYDGSCSNNRPEISYPRFNEITNALNVLVKDLDNDPIKWVTALLFDENYAYYDNLSMSCEVGEDSFDGLIYELDLSNLPEGLYYYVIVAYDGKNSGQYPGVGQMPSFTICYHNWVCDDNWSGCYICTNSYENYCGAWSDYPEYQYERIQHKNCYDQNMCTESQKKIYQPCDCVYTSVEWQDDLEVIDGDAVYFTVTWEGNCSGDVLTVKTEETTWRNGDFKYFDIEIDPDGTYDNQQSFWFYAQFVSAPTYFGYYEGETKYAVSIGRTTYDDDLNPDWDKLLTSQSRLNIQEYDRLANVETLEEYVRETQLERTCSMEITITQECFEYWDRMDVETWEKRQFNTLFDILDWIWKGSCVTCAVTIGTSESWIFLSPAAYARLMGSRITPYALAVGFFACDLCIPFPSGIGTSLKAETAAMAIESRLMWRVDELADLGIAAEYITGKNGGFVTYIDDVGRPMTEVYGLSHIGSESLTFYRKIPNFPIDLAQDYNIIKAHKEVVPLGLGKFQSNNYVLSAAEAKANQQTLQAMFADDIFAMESEYIWRQLTYNKVTLKNSVSKLEPVTKITAKNLDGAYGAYYPHDKSIEVLSTAKELVGMDGHKITRAEMIIYHTLPHEYGHAATLELIRTFRSPSGKLYTLNEISQETYWASEFFNDVSYLYAIQQDTFRRTKYLNGIYANINDIGAENYVQRVINFLHTGEYNRAQYYYQMAKEVDPVVEQKIIQAIIDDGMVSVDDFLWKNQQMCDDALTLYHDMVTTSGFEATADMHSILIKYGFIPSDIITQIPVGGLGSGGDSDSSSGIWGCTISQTQDNLTVVINYFGFLVPLMFYLLLRKKLRRNNN